MRNKNQREWEKHKQEYRIKSYLVPFFDILANLKLIILENSFFDIYKYTLFELVLYQWNGNYHLFVKTKCSTIQNICRVINCKTKYVFSRICWFLVGFKNRTITYCISSWTFLVWHVAVLVCALLFLFLPLFSYDMKIRVWHEKEKKSLIHFIPISLLHRKIWLLRYFQFGS